MVFHVRGRRMAITQQHIDRLYDDIDTRPRAKQLMADLLLFEEYPHHRAGAHHQGGAVAGSRKVVNFIMFGGPRPYGWHEHRIQLISSDMAFWERVASLKAPRPGKRQTWRVESWRKGYDAGTGLARRVGRARGLGNVRRARETSGQGFHVLARRPRRGGM